MSLPVTKPYFPPKGELDVYLDEIWDGEWLTNNGPLLRRLEEQIKEREGTPFFKAIANGTIALQLAIRELGLQGGEVITTPFSYVATCSSLVWEGCTPVFVDIDPETWTLDPERIEEAIGPNTKGILATHIFGVPCDVERIDAIGKEHGLKVLYDAAHAFGVEWKENSILRYGDASILSFHATKLFHTVEGGGVVTKDSELDWRIGYARNFGHDGPERFNGVGVNGKLSEFHAAMGHAVLDRFDEIVERRKEQWLLYDELLRPEAIGRIKIPEGVSYNYSYFPLLLDDEAQCLEVLRQLQNEGIGARRYFYPLLSDLDYTSVQAQLPVARSIASRVLCLPLYHDLAQADQEGVVEKVKESLKVTEKEG